MSKLVAITGKIGSGKTEVLNIFKSKGYQVLSADEIYKELLLQEDFVQKICNAFSIEPIIVNGKKQLNKKALSSIVFSNKEKLELLNKITHPPIMEKMFSLVNEQNKVVFCEVPLLQGSGYENKFNAVIEVEREDNLRVNSASARDNITTKEVKDRLKNQPNYENICGITHIIINNNSTLQELFNKVSAIEKEII